MTLDEIEEKIRTLCGSAPTQDGHVRGDVEAVMIAGRFMKKNRTLLATGVEEKLARLTASGARIVDELGLGKKAA